MRDTLAADVERLRAKLAKAREHGSTLAADLARVSARLDAAEVRADETSAEAARLAGERDAARERAERVNSALESARRDAETAAAAQAAGARTVLALHAYAGTLHAQLRNAGVAPEDIDPIPSPAEPEAPHALDSALER